LHIKRFSIHKRIAIFEEGHDEGMLRVLLGLLRLLKCISHIALLHIRGREEE